MNAPPRATCCYSHASHARQGCAVDEWKWIADSGFGTIQRGHSELPCQARGKAELSTRHLPLSQDGHTHVLYLQADHGTCARWRADRRQGPTAAVRTPRLRHCRTEFSVPVPNEGRVELDWQPIRMLRSKALPAGFAQATYRAACP